MKVDITSETIKYLTDQLTFGGPESELIAHAIEALCARQERENPEPLTLEQLHDRVGRPVWLINTVNGIGKWMIVETIQRGGCLFVDDDCHHRWSYSDYGKTWLAYDHEPKEAR
jgi:hypothetical protein